MTIVEIFRMADLFPRGPVPWGNALSEPGVGVYVVARVGDPEISCQTCELPFIVRLPAELDLDLDYERERWLPNEPIVYVGKTDQTIQRRLAAFYRHKCGDTSPHAGGQVLKLLSCALWVYWSRASHPRDCERVMLCAFKEEVHQAPFANWDGQRRRRRIRYI